ncbi:zinc finger protein 684 [Bombina bombina]|uniref:zinc finger protein 684 n=1 Tax=Bombina bombina TaxID=8345 RepID=UPI00235AC08C|nr:zinc finger protein 684 [Bombina bombina]XP_053577824.1 zinc finger protein 684 [Bombina bombina]XP_053577825.1 zinc finger protein 684 [Bombina bombina]
MMDDIQRITENVVKHALDILFLITGEHYIVMKINTAAVDPQDKVLPYGRQDKKKELSTRIVNHASNIIQLMNGEVPLKYDSFAVYFSAEEWEYLQEHRDQYKDIMENSQTPNTPESKRQTKDVVSEDCDVLEMKDGAVFDKNETQVETSHIAHRFADSSTGQMETSHITVLLTEPNETLSAVFSQDNCLIEYENKYTPDYLKYHVNKSLEPSENETNIFLHGQNNYIQSQQETDASEIDLRLNNVEELVESVSSDHDDNHYKSSNQEKINLCSMCGKSFSSKQYLLIHERLHSGGKPFVFKYREKKHPTNVPEELCICSDCGATFENYSELVIHKKIHSEPMSFICKECGKSYYNIISFQRHRQDHKYKKPFTCTQCGKTYRYKEKLILHLQSHAEKPVYFCNKCGKTFTNVENLTSHQKSHELKKMLVCSQCGRAFTHKSAFNQHIRSHTRKPQEYVQSCKIGGRGRGRGRGRVSTNGEIAPALQVTHPYSITEHIAAPN